MRSFLIPFLLAAMAALPLTARAEDKAPEPTETAPDEPPRDRLEARFGTGFLSGSFSDVTVRRCDIRAGIMYFPGGLPLGLGTSIHVGPAFLSLDGPLAPQLGMDAELQHWTNISLEARAELTVYENKRLAFVLHGALEMSAFDDAMEFQNAELETAQGAFDVTPFAQKHLELRYSWNRMDSGIIAKFKFGSFVPRLGVGFERFLLRFTAELDDEGKDVAERLSADLGSVERLYEEDVTSLRLTPGVDWRLSRRVELSTEFSVLPMADALYYGGNAGLRYAF